MYYEVEGGGEPLILVHGLLGSAADWRRFVPLLAGAYRRDRIQLRGYLGPASGLMCVGCVRAPVMRATKMFWDSMSVDRAAQELEPSAMSVSAVEILQRVHVREGWRQLLVEAAEYAEEREPQPGAPADAGFHALVSTGDSDMPVPPEEAVRLHRVISEVGCR
ncbi:MAG: hypothetical protein RXR82_05860 [Nitrososphaeria archaeon]